MNKILLSALAALTLGTVGATAGDIKLYSDANGQVFTTEAEGRTELKSSSTKVQAKASKLKFSGTHYLGFINKNMKEGGMVHRPWIDYEEHQGWWMRSISKVFVEASQAGHLTNSADLGFNFKTKTPYFTSEVGVFKAGATADYMFYGLHTVFNMPSFLISAQYVSSKNDQKGVVEDGDPAGTTDWNGAGYSVNGTFRFGSKKEFSVIGRYDNWENEDTVSGLVTSTENNYIYGVAWQQKKNVKWLLSGQTYDLKDSDSKDWSSAMLTAEVHW